MADRGPSSPTGAAAGDVLALGLALAVCFLAAGVAAMATPAPELDPWYRDLAKPDWTPPGLVFAVVWPVLYALMAIAAWLVWRRRRDDGRVMGALGFFAVQLVLNVAWPWAFFGAQNVTLGLIVIVLLIPALIVTMWRFAGISRLSAWLLAPYLLWLVFALALNATILFMNA